jgi:hypothetical protein
MMPRNATFRKSPLGDLIVALTNFRYYSDQPPLTFYRVCQLRKVSQRGSLTQDRNSMSTKPLDDWTDKQLAERLRIYPDGNDPSYGRFLGAEVEGRERLTSRRYALYGASFAQRCQRLAQWSPQSPV